MYNNSALIKSFKGGAAILPYTIVKFGAAEDTVINSTATVTDVLVGVAGPLGLTATDISNGALVDVALTGIAEVVLGGTVTRGARLTSNATGQGLNAAPAAGVNNPVIGIALQSGVLNQIIPVLLSQFVVQG